MSEKGFFFSPQVENDIKNKILFFYFISSQKSLVWGFPNAIQLWYLMYSSNKNWLEKKTIVCGILWHMDGLEQEVTGKEERGAAGVH